ncbi:SDR family NAD(P)-dependent oxidoreductase [Capillimicrobium parvum]|uniref:SDR family NAD(P)-dependent oxidoreductase n=1 Tax=Capillimicrobium parvum TaxID=2884022 RepID=UPI00216AB75D|nr:SDR family NAD(P)-dependent oxidoreductase [Capillimicrobium parvum]
MTGAASGIGKASALRLAADGLIVGLLDRDGTGVDATIREIATSGGHGLPLVADLSDSDAVTEAIRTAAGAGALRVVVNAAGVFSSGSIADLDEREWQRVMDINLTAAYRVCRAAIPLMAHGRHGAVINISSMSGRTKSVKGSVAYVASNGGLIAFTQTLAAQCGPDGIRVNCIAPGPVRTPMTEAHDLLDAKTISAIPLERYAEPSEIAEVVAFLASDASSYVTGETINVNGGMFTI